MRNIGMDAFEKVDNGVIQWNIDRNHISFNTDVEMRMLSEELHEYFISINIIDKFDAFLDFQFVAIGTNWKVNNSGIEYPAILDFIDSTGTLLGCDFEEQLEQVGFPMNHFFNFINDGLAIVLEYNNKKSAMKDKNGKIVKPVNFVGPEKELEKLFNEYMNKGV